MADVWIAYRDGKEVARDTYGRLYRRVVQGHMKEHRAHLLQVMREEDRRSIYFMSDKVAYEFRMSHVATPAELNRLQQASPWLAKNRNA